jgi:LysR family transcriptional regulator, glycine cleavage system transcriptional activator
MTDASAQVKHSGRFDGLAAGVAARPSVWPQQIEPRSGVAVTGTAPDSGARRTAIRRLPSLDTLRVFAVAARHLSFTKAGNELHLTQSAISHRVCALEDELGVPLFNRLTRRLELTRAGQALAQRVDRAIGDITRAVVDLDERSDRRRVAVTMPPSLASRWLLPRLPRFHARNPDIELQVIADTSPLNLRSAAIDVAIRFGRGDYPGYEASMLMPDSVFPVCSPRLLAEHGPVTSIEALLDLPLLHDSSADGRGSDWRSWLNHLGRGDLEANKGQRYSEARLLIDAATFGLGVALGRARLVSDLVADGTLVCPLPLTAPTTFSYYLLALPEAAAQPNIVRLREWLQAEAAAPIAHADLSDSRAKDAGSSVVPWRKALLAAAE